MRNNEISKLRLRLLKSRKWRYLRYLHARESLSAVADEVSSICVCGAGHGIAEVALALEYPHIKFTLTDIINKSHGYPNYHGAMQIAWEWNVPNLNFSIWDVLKPAQQRFDMVCSTEMLEHIEDDTAAAANMREAAELYIYCLVPFADKATNENERRSKRAWEQHEHFVCGYDEDRLSALFPDPIHICGAYGPDGRALRSRLDTLSMEEIQVEQASLEADATNDLVDSIPQTLHDGLGIRILSRAR